MNKTFNQLAAELSAEMEALKKKHPGIHRVTAYMNGEILRTWRAKEDAWKDVSFISEPLEIGWDFRLGAYEKPIWGTLYLALTTRQYMYLGDHPQGKWDFEIPGMIRVTDCTLLRPEINMNWAAMGWVWVQFRGEKDPWVYDDDQEKSNCSPNKKRVAHYKSLLKTKNSQWGKWLHQNIIDLLTEEEEG